MKADSRSMDALRGAQLAPTIVESVANDFLKAASAEGGLQMPLDFGILEVALLVAGIDGRILPCETRSFWQWAKRCDGYAPEVAQNAFERGMRGAGYLLALGQRGVATRKERVEAFVAETFKVLRESGLKEALGDPQKAFVLWTAMACVDRDFCDIEREALQAFRDRFASLYLKP